MIGKVYEIHRLWPLSHITTLRNAVNAFEPLSLIAVHKVKMTASNNIKKRKLQSNIQYKS